jgi:cytochrome c oxidase subunit 2
MRLGPVLLVVSAPLVLAACGGDQNAVAPKSGAEHSIAQLWWVMLAASCIGFGVIGALLLAGWFRRGRSGPETDATERQATKLVVVCGVVVPILVLGTLFVWADVFVINSTAAPAPGSVAMSIRVVAHDWWWAVEYPGTRAVTANEIHIPTNTRVQVIGTTADVIHSFWVPELNRKIDLIPGLTNRILLDARKPGVYRGQCSEFCGLEHAHMAVAVVAQAPAAFRAWLANMSSRARAPTTTAARAGRALFLGESCASCHSIRGTSAQGAVGPDLTHVASRATLAAETIPNDDAFMRAWIADPQRFKPGALMPAVPLSSRALGELTAYLESLS